MAKKIRFPLEMEQGVEVRSLEELRDKFSLARMLVYVSNGKLITWLRDRYVDDIADAIEALAIEDIDLAKKVSAIFDVPYDEQTAIDMEKSEARNRRLGMLKEYTMERRFLDAIDSVAFTQDEVYDLLDEDMKTIFLCGEKFSIPLSKKGMTYIGVNKPVVIVDSKQEVNWQEKSIALIDVIYDEKYQTIVDEAERKRNGLGKEQGDFISKDQPTTQYSSGGYCKDSILNFMLSPSEKSAAEGCYNKIKNQLDKFQYDIDSDVADVRKKLLDSGLAGLAENYLKNL